ncbi:MAG: ribonuclease III [Clostridiales bacterium]|nr:ribonuclease III [Clostridiales bacterium]
MPEYSDLIDSIGFVFKNKNNIKLAMTHPSFAAENNQRLEFLGDAVLELCISNLIFTTLPKMNEGQLTALRASFVCEDALFTIAELLQLDKYIRMNPPLQKDTRGRKSILADAVEALLAAVFIEGGFSSALSVVSRLWDKEMMSKTFHPNSKSALQELLQASHLSEPQYVTLVEQGPPHKRKFTVAVLSQGKELARAQGKSKKEAQQQAAELALAQLQGRIKRDET